VLIFIGNLFSTFGFTGDQEASVPTLVLPYGAREIAMGDVGVTTARGEVGSFWNPALLGAMDQRLQYGAACYQFGNPHLFFQEQRYRGLPEDNQNHVICLSYRSFKSSAGGFSLFVNHHSLGPGKSFNVRNVNKYETIYGLTWGFGFQEVGVDNHTIGITTKYIRSVLAPSGYDGEGVGTTLAFDFGYLWKINSLFSAGLNLSNMGPHIDYVNRWQRDPLPFKGDIAIGFQKDIPIPKIPLQIRAEYKVSRFLVKNNYDGTPDPFYKAIATSWKKNSNSENWKSILHNFGYELTICDHFHVRQGFYIDNRDGEKEMHWGFGGTFLDHFSLDFYHIYAPRAYFCRHGAWGLTGTVFNVFKRK
jgi:hypothetical protein